MTDKITVTCGRDGCSATTEFVPSVTKPSNPSERTEQWSVTLTISADNSLVVVGANCPEHRIEDQVDSLLETYQDFVASYRDAAVVASELDT